jgi:hypothetical protein
VRSGLPRRNKTRSTSLVIFNGWKKPHASWVGLPHRVMKGPRGILYAYKPQDAFKRVTRKGIGWCGCQARVTCTTGEALFYFQSPVRSLWITCEVSSLSFLLPCPFCHHYPPHLSHLTPSNRAHVLAARLRCPPCPPAQQTFSACLDRSSTTGLRLGSGAHAAMVPAPAASAIACGPLHGVPCRVFARHLRVRQ